MHFWTNRIILIVVATLSVFTSSGQNTTQSPYSRFGAGIPHWTGTIKESALGGGLGYAHSQFYSLSNTASVTRLATPTFDLGLRMSQTTLTNDKSQHRYATGNINHFAFGMPVKRGWAVQFGLKPHSQIGYNITDDEPQAVNDTLTYKNRYTGNGGVSRSFLGIAKDIFSSKDSMMLAFGADVGYYFGNRAFSRMLEWDDNAHFFNTRNVALSQYGGAAFRFSTLFNIEESWGILGVGVTLDLPIDIEEKRTEVIESYENNGFGGYNVKDTAYFADGISTRYQEPSVLKFGLSFQPTENWLFTTDFIFQGSEADKEWTGRQKYSFGARYQASPRFNSFTPLLKATQFAVTGFVGNSGLVLRDTPLKEFGMGIAAMIPLKKSNSASWVTLGLNYQKFGTTSNGLLVEDKLGGFIGLSLAPSRLDQWFVKRRYN